MAVNNRAEPMMPASSQLVQVPVKRGRNFLPRLARTCPICGKRVPASSQKSKTPGHRRESVGERHAHLWCSRGELNPHALIGHMDLNHARLPIPPLERA